MRISNDVHFLQSDCKRKNLRNVSKVTSNSHYALMKHAAQWGGQDHHFPEAKLRQLSSSHRDINWNDISIFSELAFCVLLSFWYMVWVKSSKT